MCNHREPAPRAVRHGTAANQAAFIVMALLIGLRAPAAAAQVKFQLVGATANIDGCTLADETSVTGVGTPIIDTCAAAGLTPSVLGHEFGIRCYRRVEDQSWLDPTWVTSEIHARVFLDGDNSSEITIEWLNLAFCDEDDDLHFADANVNLMLDVSLEIVHGTAPAGTPVIVYYNWEAFGGATTSHECQTIVPMPASCVVPEEDPVCSVSTLFIDGTEVLAGRFNRGSGSPIPSLCPTAPPIIQCVSSVPGWNRKSNQGAAIWSAVGSTIDVAINSSVEAHLREPQPQGMLVGGVEAAARFHGKLRLTVGFPFQPGPNPVLPTGAPYSLFSVDIGSDREMSDPANGDPVFDPGDCYQWGGLPLPPCGINGIRDDADIFAGLDWPPIPPDCPPALSAAPICSGVLNKSSHFDLDGLDNLDVALSALLGPALGPIPSFPSDCILGTDHLAISFDDDGPAHYAGGAAPCETPVTSDSPYAAQTFGKSTARDEVIGVMLAATLSPITATPAFTYAVADETSVHPSLAPNPDLGINEDDDVDALDMMRDPALCPFWYFSADHEATGIDPNTGADLDPGNIYEVVPGGSPILVVDYSLHLGLHGGVDIDAFEFAWLYHDVDNTLYLALLFSVDDDDPLTAAVDESGGLDPTTIYASFLDGLSFDYLTVPLGEDIDAISTWQSALLPQPTTGACCYSGGCTVVGQALCAIFLGSAYRGNGTDCADVNGNGQADVCECLGCRGDMNADNRVNGLDIDGFIDCMVAGTGNCGCADMNADGALGMADTGLFVTTLLQGPLVPCP